MTTIAQAFGSKSDKEHKATCSDCGAPHLVSQFAWDMAMKFYELLAKRQEPPLKGVARCEDCASVWEEKQQHSAAQRQQRDAVLFRRMRQGLAGIKAGKVDRAAVLVFGESLPEDFKLEHGVAWKAFQQRADELFSKSDTEGSGWGEF